MNKLVTVVVPTLNSEATIAECLQSIFSNDNPPEFEVIVVDGGSVDDTIQIAQKYPVKIYYSNKPQARQRNLGILQAAGDIIAFTDADCRVNNNWLSIILKHFHDTTIGSVGGPNLTPTDDPFLPQCIGVLMESHLGSAGTRNTAVYDKCREVDHNPPVNAAVLRNLLIAVDGFPDNFAVSEDVILDEKIKRQGYKLIYDPQMIVWHHRRNTLKSFVKQLTGYGRGRASAFIKYPRSLPLTYICALLFTIGTLLTVPLYSFVSVLKPVIILGWILYLLFISLSSIYIAIMRKKLVYSIVLPFLAIIEHFSLGFGFIHRLLRPYK